MFSSKHLASLIPIFVFLQEIDELLGTKFSDEDEEELETELERIANSEAISKVPILPEVPTTELPKPSKTPETAEPARKRVALEAS